MARTSLLAFNWLVYLFLLAPVVVVLIISFSSANYLQFPPPGLSLRWYVNYLTDPRWNFPGRQLLYTFLISPIIVPVMIIAMALYALFSPLRLVGTMPGLVLGHTILAFPYVLVNVGALLYGLDPRLEHAALSLGASPWQTFRTVTLPLILPGVLSGAIFAFSTSWDEVVISIFLSGLKTTTLPKQMLDGVRTEIDPTIAAVASILIVVSCVGLLLVQRLAGQYANEGAPAE
jgi:putative spermidine/putrescine transport system permease protein